MIAETDSDTKESSAKGRFKVNDSQVQYGKRCKCKLRKKLFI